MIQEMMEQQNGTGSGNGEQQNELEIELESMDGNMKGNSGQPAQNQDGYGLFVVPLLSNREFFAILSMLRGILKYFVISN